MFFGLPHRPLRHYTRGFTPAIFSGWLRRSTLEILDLRHFSSVDLRPLLDDETQVWSRLLSWDYGGAGGKIPRFGLFQNLPRPAPVGRGRTFCFFLFFFVSSEGGGWWSFVSLGGRRPHHARGGLAPLG